MKDKPEEPFISDELLSLDVALSRAEHVANAGGHSAIIMRGDRQVRITIMRPERGVHYNGPAIANLIYDERTGNAPWITFCGWSSQDKTLAWQEVAHTYMDRNGCASKLCAQYGHAGGPKVIR